MPPVSSASFNTTLTSYTTRTQNRHLNSKLPAYNSPLCQALYDFIRLLLGIRKNSDPWPPSPTASQLATFNSGWCPGHSDESVIERISKQVATNGNSPSQLYGKKKALHGSLQSTFLRHLEEIRFPCGSFNWDEPCTSAWNEAFSGLIIRHWDYSRGVGAFVAYPMDPYAAAEFSTIKALIFRWFNGRRDEIRREQRRPGSHENQKKLIQKSHLRKKLSNHRTETLRRLGVNEKFQDVFADPLCNSDTEVLDDGTLQKIKPAWRSEIANSLAVRVDQLTIQSKQSAYQKTFGPGQLLESRRQPPTTASTSRQIPRSLAQDWYHKNVLQDLSSAARDQLSDKPPVGLSDLWFALEPFMPS